MDRPFAAVPADATSTGGQQGAADGKDTGASSRGEEEGERSGKSLSGNEDSGAVPSTSKGAVGEAAGARQKHHAQKKQRDKGSSPAVKAAGAGKVQGERVKHEGVQQQAGAAKGTAASAGPKAAKKPAQKEGQQAKKQKKWAAPACAAWHQWHALSSEAVAAAYEGFADMGSRHLCLGSTHF